MPVTRRDFLFAPVAAAAASTLPVSLLASCTAETPALPDLSSWASVRSQFLLDPTIAHFASFYIVSHPLPVQAAIDGYRRAIDRNPFLVVSQGKPDNVRPQVRRTIADYLGGREEDVSLTSNTTTSLAMVYHGLPLQRGDEVLCTTHTTTCTTSRSAWPPSAPVRRCARLRCSTRPLPPAPTPSSRRCCGAWVRGRGWSA